MFFFRDSENADAQEIFMYDIPTQTVSRLNGELSTAFVNVAEDNANTQDPDAATASAEQSTEAIDSADAEDQPSNIVETYVKFESEADSKADQPQVLINSGYSVIKN